VNILSTFYTIRHPVLGGPPPPAFRPLKPKNEKKPQEKQHYSGSVVTTAPRCPQPQSTMNHEDMSPYPGSAFVCLCAKTRMRGKQKTANMKDTQTRETRARHGTENTGDKEKSQCRHAEDGQGVNEHHVIGMRPLSAVHRHSNHHLIARGGVNVRPRGGRGLSDLHGHVLIRIHVQVMAGVLVQARGPVHRNC
jgi:hypothetical protein